MKHDIAGALLKPRQCEYSRQLNARPLRDGTPPLVALVKGYLGARRKGPQLGERQPERPVDEAVHAQLPVAKFGIEQPLILVPLWHCRTIRRKRRRDFRNREL